MFKALKALKANTQYIVYLNENPDNAHIEKVGTDESTKIRNAFAYQYYSNDEFPEARGWVQDDMIGTIFTLENINEATRHSIVLDKFPLDYLSRYCIKEYKAELEIE